MIRAKNDATLSSKVVTFYCLAVLVMPGCGPRRIESANHASVSSPPGHAKATNPYRAVKARDFSQHIRAVFKTSAERYEADAARRAGTEQASPDDPRLQAAMREAEERPDDAEAILRLAELYLESNRLLEAFQLYSGLEARSEPNPRLARALATIWDRWGDYPRALQFATEAVAAEEIPAEDWFFLGRIHLHGDNWQAGVDALRKSLDLNPAQTDAWLELAAAYSKRRDWNSASSCLRRALSLNPSRNEIRRSLGAALARSGDQEGALRELTALDPAAKAYNQLGEILRSEGRWQAAHQAFSAALVADPSLGAARANLESTIPYLPLPTSVTLPSFDLPQPDRQVHLGPFPGPGGIDPMPGFESFASPIQAGRRTDPAPLVIEIERSGPHPAPGFDNSSAREGAPLEVGIVQEVIQLPSLPAPSPPRDAIKFEPTVVRLETSEPVPFPPALPLAAATEVSVLPASGIVQLPAWDPVGAAPVAEASLDLVALPTNPDGPGDGLRLAASSSEVENTADPRTGFDFGRVAEVNLADVRRVEVVDIASFMETPPLVQPGRPALRVSNGVEIVDPAQGLAFEPAAAPFESAVEWVDPSRLGSGLPAPAWPGERELTGLSSSEAATRTTPSVLPAMLQAVLDSLVTLPEVAPPLRRWPAGPAPPAGRTRVQTDLVTTPPGWALRGIPALHVRAPELPSAREALANAGWVGLWSNEATTTTVAGPVARVRPQTIAPADRAIAMSWSRTADRGRIDRIAPSHGRSRHTTMVRPGWPETPSYPIPFVGRDSNRFAVWRAAAGDLPNGAATAPPLAIAIVTTLSAGLLGAAVVALAGFGAMAVLFGGALLGAIAGCCVGASVSEQPPIPRLVSPPRT